MIHIKSDYYPFPGKPRPSMVIVMIFTVFIFSLSGCMNGEYKLLFTDIQGLKPGAGLMFDQHTIGEVREIVYTRDGEYLVSIVVDKNFQAAMTEHSRFEIIPPSSKSEDRVIVMTLEEKGGNPLEKGVAVKALAPTPFSPMEKITPVLKKLESGFEKLDSGFEKFVNDLKNVPESDSFKAIENKMDELGRQMKESGKDVKENIKNNILPKLKNQIDELGRKFEKEGEPGKTEPLDKKLQELHDI
ncbi:MAG: MCE family protein [Desulfamplus sp.]|nr:MCE family protein [Desulfamplus sp.]